MRRNGKRKDAGSSGDPAGRAGRRPGQTRRHEKKKASQRRKRSSPEAPDRGQRAHDSAKDEHISQSAALPETPGDSATVEADPVGEPLLEGIFSDWSPEWEALRALPANLYMLQDGIERALRRCAVETGATSPFTQRYMVAPWDTPASVLLKALLATYDDDVPRKSQDPLRSALQTLLEKSYAGRLGRRRGPEPKFHPVEVPRLLLAYEVILKRLQEAKDDADYITKVLTRIFPDRRNTIEKRVGGIGKAISEGRAAKEPHHEIARTILAHVFTISRDSVTAYLKRAPHPEHRPGASGPTVTTS
jgi:hypothetical protein